MIPPFLHRFTIPLINIVQPINQATSLIIRKSAASPSSSLGCTESQSEYSILFLQRAYSPRDVFSGDLCLPGGHRQVGETIIQTAIRQTYEQIGVVLKQQQCIGAIDHLFGTRKSLTKDQKRSRLAVMIFYVDSWQVDAKQLKMNQKQIRSYAWIGLDKFLNGKQQDFRKWIYINKINNKQILMECPAYDIKMPRVLWGLTLMVMSKFIQCVIDNEAYKVQKLYINHMFVTRFINHALDYRIIDFKQIKKQIYNKFMQEVGWEPSKQITPKF